MQLFARIPAATAITLDAQSLCVTWISVAAAFALDALLLRVEQESQESHWHGWRRGDD
jgi:hypothetical protein